MKCESCKSSGAEKRENGVKLCRDCWRNIHLAHAKDSRTWIKNRMREQTKKLAKKKEKSS